MDLLDDIFSESAAVKVPAAKRFKPKVKAQPKKGALKAAQSTEVKAIEEQPASTDLPFSVQPDVCVEKKSEAPTSSSLTKAKDSVGLSTTATAELPETHAPDVSSIQNAEEIPVFPDVSFANSSTFRPSTSQKSQDITMLSTYQDSGDFQIDVEKLEAGDFSCLDAVEMMSEAGGASGKRASKFKPKPKSRNRAKEMVEDLSDAIPDSLQAGLDGSFSTNPTTYQSEKVVFEDADSLMAPNKIEQRGVHGKFDGLISPGNTLDEGPLLSEANDELASNQVENDNGDHLEEGKSKKRRGRRSKNASSENDKLARKRKKALQESDQTVVKPPKKFPHATRRKRCVDKSLFEVPEEELDLHKLPMKDLISWGEHKERETKKQAASVQSVPTNERTGNLWSEASPYNDDALEFGQDRDFSDNPSTSGIQTDTGYFDYHTHRSKQSRAKWLKKDTELFYQGISQFGTDLSMIQQLFPGRSLEQIRSKYKKEQKQNPMMMHDAQTNRATDHKCFELVIKTLEAAREAEKEYTSSEEDNLAHPTCKEGQPEENTDNNATPQESTNPEQNHKDETVGDDPDKSQAGSPTRSYDDGDDWDTYTGL